MDEVLAESDKNVPKSIIALKPKSVNTAVTKARKRV